jgi:hypothetical protein
MTILKRDSVGDAAFRRGAHQAGPVEGVPQRGRAPLGLGRARYVEISSPKADPEADDQTQRVHVDPHLQRLGSGRGGTQPTVRTPRRSRSRRLHAPRHRNLDRPAGPRPRGRRHGRERAVLAGPIRSGHRSHRRNYDGVVEPLVAEHLTDAIGWALTDWRT